MAPHVSFKSISDSPTYAMGYSGRKGALNYHFLSISRTYNFQTVYVN